MKKTLAALVAAASLSLSTVAVAGPAGAVGTAGDKVVSSETSARAGCVTKAEYRKVKNGMTKKRVHATFGTKGMLVSKDRRFEARGYKGCTSRRAGVGVVYTRNKVASKAAQW